jgi:hypothetical protein
VKWVRIENGIVREIIPEAATIPSVAHWYGEEFAAQCVEAPNEVEQNWTYRAGNFSPPALPSPPEPTAENDLLAMSVDHEYRITLLELGVL